MMEKSVFEVRNVTKEIAGKKILNNINFTCKDFTSVAIKGSNGSGKSTLLKVLAGIYEPSSGEVKRGNRKVGYVTEHFPENLRFKVKEYLMLTGSFQGTSKQHIEEELLDYIEMFNLQPYVDIPLKKCSKGTKQKVGLIQALMSKPDLLLLDEPLTGLDSSTQNELLLLLGNLKKQATVIFTTHEEKMIENLADSVFHIDSGEMVRSPNQGVVQKLVKVKFSDPAFFEKLNLDEITYEGNTASILVDASGSDELLLALLNNQCSIMEVRERR